MTAQQLELLIEQGEGYNLEFKQAIPAKASELAIEICAFANTAGGTLLVGVDDKSRVTGVRLDNTLRSRLQHIIKCIEPDYAVQMEELVIQGKKVLCIHCSSGDQKPYTVSGAIILRNGPNSEKITSVQRMRDFFQQSDRLFFDEGVCKTFKYPGDFDDKKFTGFTAAAGISATLDTVIKLENLRLFINNRQFKNGAVLFFAKMPQQFFDWASTRCTLFKGTDKNHILDDKIFDGNLIQQYEGSLKYVYSKLQVEYQIADAGPRRDVWELPEVALKEALLNALAHRDYYEKGGRITVEIFEDRLEITNPGGLINSIPRTEFGRRSLSRNPLIFGLFMRLKLVEQVGSGIGRIKKAMLDAGLQAPDFNLEGMFCVTLYRPLTFEKLIEEYWAPRLNPSQSNILWQIHDNPNISKREIAEHVGLSKTAIDKNIEKLKEMGILKRIGSDRSGYWEIIRKKMQGG